MHWWTSRDKRQNYDVYVILPEYGLDIGGIVFMNLWEGSPFSIIWSELGWVGSDEICHIYDIYYAILGDLGTGNQGIQTQVYKKLRFVCLI